MKILLGLLTLLGFTSASSAFTLPTLTDKVVEEVKARGISVRARGVSVRVGNNGGFGAARFNHGVGVFRNNHNFNAFRFNHGNAFRFNYGNAFRFRSLGFNYGYNGAFRYYPTASFSSYYSAPIYDSARYSSGCESVAELRAEIQKLKFEVELEKARTELRQQFAQELSAAIQSLKQR